LKAGTAGCSSCRPTALISTRFSRLSPNSRRCCERAHPRRPLNGQRSNPPAPQPAECRNLFRSSGHPA
jgi:hypothetical protein